MKTKTGDRKGTLLTSNLPHSKNAGENHYKSHCTDKLAFIGENTNPPKVILREDYEHYNKFLRYICNTAVAEGAFVIQDHK